MSTPSLNSQPSDAVSRLLANIVLDPCALSMGKPENYEERCRGRGGFVQIPLIGDGERRHQENLQSERRQAGGC